MIMVDTSAWIEFLRDTGSPVCKKLLRLLDKELAVSDPIWMEVLAGARSDAHLEQLRGLLARYTHVQATLADYISLVTVSNGPFMVGGRERPSDRLPKMSWPIMFGSYYRNYYFMIYSFFSVALTHSFGVKSEVSG